MSMNPNKVIIPCRFSYLHCWEPDSVNGGDPRYSAAGTQRGAATAAGLAAAYHRVHRLGAREL